MRIISGKFRNRTILAPKGKQTRPTLALVRKALFDMLQGYIEDCNLLDLFAGSGAIGFEALSREAQHVTFVESHPLSLRYIYANIKELDVANQTHVFKGKAESALKKLKGPFDLIYIDPPYDFNPQGLLSHCINLLAPEGLLIIEKRLNKKLTKIEHLTLWKSRDFGLTSLEIWRAN